HLLALITPIVTGAADYTKGNRFLHARELRSMPGRRRVGNAGLSFLTKLASGYWDIFDPTNGYTAIHASLVPLLSAGRIGKRYFFESSLLLNLSLLRAVVRDVYIPARYPAGAASHLSESRAALQFPWRLLRGFVRRVRLEYFVRDFTAVSLYLVAGVLLGLFGAVWGVWHWAVSAQAGAVASTGTVMIAVLPIIVGVQLLLQALTLDIQNVPTQPVHTSVRLVPAQPLVGLARAHPVATFEANVRGTWTLLEACRTLPEPPIVAVASSDKAYGASAKLPYVETDPLAGSEPYEASKAITDILAQTYARSYGLPTRIARCGNIYGIGDWNWSRIVPGTIRSLLR